MIAPMRFEEAIHPFTLWVNQNYCTINRRELQEPIVDSGRF